MKIIALLPVKNEAWVLPSYLSSISKVADEIIALDDNSIDKSREILLEHNVTVLGVAKDDNQVNMSQRRQTLLDAGRKAGGTHFIWLDADEVLSSDFASKIKTYLSPMQPGQSLTLRWVHAWKNTSDYLADPKSAFGFIWKDFIFCDDKISNFENKFISESRTPISNIKTIQISDDQGVVIHWAYSNWDSVQYKQAWYQCTELIRAERSAFRINVSYSTTKDIPDLKTQKLPEKWLSGIQKPGANRPNHHIALIEKYFCSYGVEYFEKLDIWHIQKLEQIFIQKVGRRPRPQVPPHFLLRLNDVKNWFKQRLS